MSDDAAAATGNGLTAKATALITKAATGMAAAAPAFHGAVDANADGKVDATEGAAFLTQMKADSPQGMMIGGEAALKAAMEGAETTDPADGLDATDFAAGLAKWLTDGGAAVTAASAAIEKGESPEWMICDADAEKSGCATDLKCGTRTSDADATEEQKTETAKDNFDQCIKADLCDKAVAVLEKETWKCSAVKLGAAVAASLAVFTQM